MMEPVKKLMSYLGFFLILFLMTPLHQSMGAEEMNQTIKSKKEVESVSKPKVGDSEKELNPEKESKVTGIEVKPYFKKLKKGRKNVRTVSQEKADQWKKEGLELKKALIIEEGEVVDALLVFGESIVVLGTVKGDIGIANGDVYVIGEVKGNVAAAAGSIIVIGQVDGDVATAVGSVKVSGEVKGGVAVVLGHIEKTSLGKIKEGADFGLTGFKVKTSKRVEDQAEKHDFFQSNLMSFYLVVKFGLFLFWLAIAIIGATFFETVFVRVSQKLYSDPLSSFGVGFLWFIFSLVIFIGLTVLSFLLVGIPLLFLFFIFVLVLDFFGMVVVFHVVGSRLASLFKRPNASIYFTVLLGVCSLSFLGLIPILGDLLWFVAGLFGCGAALLSRFGTQSVEKKAPQLPA